MNSKTLGGREAEVLHKTLNRLISKEPTILIKSKPQMTIEQQIDELTKRISVLESKASVYGLGSKLNLVEMEEKFDKILESQTPEDTIKWLKEKRGEKLEPEKDYEIIEHGSDFDLKTKELSGPIFKVRRLSDRVEFKLGQDASFVDGAYFQPQIGKIERFTEYCGTMNVSIRCGSISYAKAISELQPLPERKPLFKDFNGNDMFDEDKGFFVSKKEFTIDEWTVHCATAPPERSDFYIFSTREAAEKYIISKRSVFTLDDIIEALHEDPTEKAHSFYDDLARERCGFGKEKEK